MNTIGIYKCLSCGKLYEIPLVAIPDVGDKCPYCKGVGWKVGEYNPNEPEIAESIRAECCEDWKENVKIINSWQAIAIVHSSIVKSTTVKPFKYCPWCGKKREE